MTYIPLFLQLGSQARIVIVGGGAVALAKLEALEAAASQVHLLAEKISAPLAARIEQLGATCVQAAYYEDALNDATLVIAATNDRALNHRIHADAKKRGIAVNVVDTPELCDFIFPAVVRRGDVQIAISTGGASPTLARFLKQRIEQLLPWNFSELVKWIGKKRTQVQSRLRHIQSRRLLWSDIIEGPIPQEVIEGNYARAEKLFNDALEGHSATPQAAFYLIGAGPGHPDLVTVKAVQLIGRADVILYDRLIPAGLLARYARKDALAIAVGKTRGKHHLQQQEIDALLEKHLAAGKIVVRLKGGDPGIYAHAAEELAIAKKLGVPAQIVPGVTAALGCAAHAGIPLTERGGAQGVRFLTLYEESLHDEALWRSIGLAPKETLVFYMTTGHRERVCERLLQSGFAAETPMLLIEQGTTPNHAEFEATVGDFAERYHDFSFITPALIIVGDVVRWRTEHSWREASEERSSYFEQTRIAAGG